MLKGNLEENVLTLLCYDSKYAAAVAMKVNPQLFSTRSYRRIAEAAFNHLAQFSQAPRRHLQDILQADLRRGEDGILLGRVLGDIDALASEIQPDYVMAELGLFVDLRKINQAIERAADAVNAGDASGARDALYKTDLGEKDSPGIWLHDPSQALSFMDNREEDYFSTGISVLDNFGIRPRRKELFLFVGQKKIGKSWWLAEFGKQGIMHRKKTLHITLENGEQLTSQRYMQNLFAMSTSHLSTIRVPIFKKDQFGRCTSIDFDTRVPEHINPEMRATLAKRLEALRSRPPLLIKEFATGGLTIATLRSYLDMLARLHDYQPDLVLLDYPELMHLDANNLRISIGQLLRDLRGLAHERNFALVCPAQGNRGGESARVVNSTHMAEDWSKAGTADIVCTINKTAAERRHGLARIFVDAARRVEDKYLVMISQNYATGQFCIDSVFMNKHLNEEINRISGDDEEEAA